MSVTVGAPIDRPVRVNAPVALSFSILVEHERLGAVKVIAVVVPIPVMVSP
jgi:hypothetical protein